MNLALGVTSRMVRESTKEPGMLRSLLRIIAALVIVSVSTPAFAAEGALRAELIVI